MAMTMIDQILNIGSTFDWITPLSAFLRDFFSGPVSDFGIPIDSSWGGHEIKHLLRDYGIQAWGFMYDFDGEVLMFTVQKRHADLTYSLLDNLGVPILYASIEV